MADNLQIGKILSYVGGVLGIISGLSLFFTNFGLSDIFDMIGYGFEYFQSMFVVIAVISLAGGITTIIGASLINSKGPKTAGIVVIIGSVIAGLNLISLIGGILLTGALDNKNKYNSSTYVPPASTPIQPMVSPKKYCRNCGAPLAEGTNFCQSCGTSITQE